MIVVKIELHRASTGEVEEIGRMYLCNTGGTRDRGEYKAYVCRKGSTGKPAEMYETDDGLGRALQMPMVAKKAARTGAVSDYPRLTYNVWRLICRAIRSCFPEEK